MQPRAKLACTRRFLPLSRAYRSSAHPTLARSYATHSSLGSSPSSSSNPRKTVTVFNDDGRQSWGQLSTGGKIARSTQHSVNLAVILSGLFGTAFISYILWTTVFSPEGKTSQFNRAVDRVRNDPKCEELLGGPGKDIKAYGEPSGSRWARNVVSSKLEKDRMGVEHFRMHFNVDGSKNRGVVDVHMIKKPGENNFHYRHLALIVKGQPTYYLENADEEKTGKTSGKKMFGVRWW